MRTVEKLSGFKNHLYDMLVAMMSRCKAGIEGKEEDVHSEIQSPHRPLCDLFWIAPLAPDEG
jgi:hypothetical protein